MLTVSTNFCYCSFFVPLKKKNNTWEAAEGCSRQSVLLLRKLQQYQLFETNKLGNYTFYTFYIFSLDCFWRLSAFTSPVAWLGTAFLRKTMLAIQYIQCYSENLGWNKQLYVTLSPCFASSFDQKLLPELLTTFFGSHVKYHRIDVCVKVRVFSHCVLKILFVCCWITLARYIYVGIICNYGYITCDGFILFPTHLFRVCGFSKVYLA